MFRDILTDRNSIINRMCRFVLNVYCMACFHLIRNHNLGKFYNLAKEGNVKSYYTQAPIVKYIYIRGLGEQLGQ